MNDLGFLPAEPGQPAPQPARKMRRNIFDWIDLWPERGVRAGRAGNRVIIAQSYSAGPNAFATVCLGAVVTPAVARQLAAMILEAADQAEA